MTSAASAIDDREALSTLRSEVELMCEDRKFIEATSHVEGQDVLMGRNPEIKSTLISFVGDRRRSFTRGMVPSDQRLESPDLARVQRDNRLVQEFKLVFLDGAPQVIFQLHLVGDRFMHFLVKHTVAGLPISLGLVQCGIRIAQHLL